LIANQMTVERRTAPATVALLLLAACTHAGAPANHRPSHSASSLPSGKTRRPNIVLIVTDDQRWDTLRYMPHVHHDLVRQGTRFTNAFVVNPLCCPSRTSILTGDYSHTTGVYTDGGVDGPQTFDPSSTLAVWLQDAGYRTALAGKYVNHFKGPAPPPGWDRWWSYSGPFAYYGYRIDANGRLVQEGHTRKSYATDRFGADALGFLRSIPATSPFFLYFAPYSPHAPATPPARHADAFAHLRSYRPPSYNEADVSDKPSWLRSQPRLSPRTQTYIDDLRRRQLQAALAIDDAVRSIVAELKATHRLANTVIVYTSDNGLSWGEHRWHNKIAPYEEDIRVPLVVRDTRLAAPLAHSDAIVANIDIAPTIAALAGITIPRVDGTSLVPLLEGTSSSVRGALLIEHEQQARARGRKPSVPTYCAIRTPRWAYVQYADGARELYGLRTDPFELANVADTLTGVAHRLEDRLQTLCTPRPPGW
jgi:N-acetylglucosamine-6-sulfatase